MPELAVALALLACIFGVAGGYGGAKFFARQVARELGEIGADLVGFDLRIKKLEGRRVREDHPSGGPPKELAELAQLLGAAGKRPQLVQPHAETETDIINRAFPPTKANGG